MGDKCEASRKGTRTMNEPWIWWEDDEQRWWRSQWCNWETEERVLQLLLGVKWKKCKSAHFSGLPVCRWQTVSHASLGPTSGSLSLSLSLSFLVARKMMMVILPEKIQQKYEFRRTDVSKKMLIYNVCGRHKLLWLFHVTSKWERISQWTAKIFFLFNTKIMKKQLKGCR